MEFRYLIDCFVFVVVVVFFFFFFHFQAKEELKLAKKNYEALNTQLLEEIPGFNEQCMALVVDCLKIFAVAQNRLYHEIQQQYEQLVQVLY